MAKRNPKLNTSDQTNTVPVIAGDADKREVEQSKAVIPTADPHVRKRFTKEMVIRAHEDGILPHEILYAIAVDPNLKFTDWIAKRGELICVERTATVTERIDCAKAVLPYYASKKPIEVAHQGEIKVLHALAESPLDAVTLDEHGNVIDDAEELEDID